jgi:hypothetical protein
MRHARAAVLGLAAATAALGAAASAGTRVEPAPFPEYPDPSGPPRGEIDLPATLPEPVHRWLQGIYGERVPVVDSVVVTGRARIRPFGVWLPARFRFVHDVGRGYRHYIEATLFGRPLMAVNERYLDGASLMEIPIVGTDEGPRIDQAANLGMWAELASAAPSALVTDPRVHWRGIDSETAQLDVPFGEAARDSFTVRFDPTSGAMRTMEAWRYRSSAAPEKTLWIAATEPGPTVGPLGLPAVGTATWADQGDPWARFVTEDIRTDVDVSTYIRARGI